MNFAQKHLSMLLLLSLQKLSDLFEAKLPIWTEFLHQETKLKLWCSKEIWIVWVFAVLVLAFVIVIKTVFYWNALLFSSYGSSTWGLPGDSVITESACHAGDAIAIPGSERSLGEGNGNPLQYSCLGNPWTEEPGRRQSMGL